MSHEGLFSFEVGLTEQERATLLAELSEILVKTEPLLEDLGIRHDRELLALDLRLDLKGPRWMELSEAGEKHIRNMMAVYLELISPDEATHRFDFREQFSKRVHRELPYIKKVGNFSLLAASSPTRAAFEDVTSILGDMDGYPIDVR